MCRFLHSKVKISARSRCSCRCRVTVKFRSGIWKLRMHVFEIAQLHNSHAKEASGVFRILVRRASSR